MNDINQKHEYSLLSSGHLRGQSLSEAVTDHATCIVPSELVWGGPIALGPAADLACHWGAVMSLRVVIKATSHRGMSDEHVASQTRNFRR